MKFVLNDRQVYAWFCDIVYVLHCLSTWLDTQATTPDVNTFMFWLKYHGIFLYSGLLDLFRD